MKWVLGMLVVAVSGVTATWFTYPFNLGEPGGKFYITEGTIYPFSFANNFEIPRLPRVTLTGVRVIVNAVYKPKVVFSRDSRSVSIVFTFPQWTHSHYKIIGKGELTCPQKNI